MSAGSYIELMLKQRLDVVGWKPPWHYHWKLVRNGVDHPHDPNRPPVYAANCSAEQCEARGCPKTQSGFATNQERRAHP